MALHEFNYSKEPTVNIVKEILSDAIKMKATDIHFDPQANGMIIKFRIDGDLVVYADAPENTKKNITTRIKILAGMNITESNLPQNGCINFEVDSNGHNMTVSSIPLITGERIVIHLSNYEQSLEGLDSLGFNFDDVVKIKNIIKDTSGVLLVTGETASGKMTTMYSLLKEFDNTKNNIITVEEPVKLRIEGINQIQVYPEKGLTMSNILNNLLYQDPNIICISDIVDDEVARIALRAANTGKLVISSMHTKNACNTIENLLSMDVENYLISNSLNGIISQRLVKKLCPACKKKRETTDYEKNVLKRILDVSVNEIYYPVGCSECINGYQGRMPVAEVIEINDELRSAIANSMNRNDIYDVVYKNNNSIVVDGFSKVLDGLTSFEEIIRVIDINIDFPHNDELRDVILGNEVNVEEVFSSTIPNIIDENITDAPEIDQVVLEEQNTTEEVSEKNEKAIVEIEEVTNEETPIVEVEETNSDDEDDSNDTEVKEVSIQNTPVNEVKAEMNYDDFSYDESYINNF